MQTGERTGAQPVVHVIRQAERGRVSRGVVAHKIRWHDLYKYVCTAYLHDDAASRSTDQSEEKADGSNLWRRCCFRGEGGGGSITTTSTFQEVFLR